MHITISNLSTQTMILLLDNMFTDYSHVIGCADGTHHVELIHPYDTIIIKHNDMITLIRDNKTVTIKPHDYLKITLS